MYLYLLLEALKVSGRLRLTWVDSIDLENFGKSEGPSAEAINTRRRWGGGGAAAGRRRRWRRFWPPENFQKISL